ncbi:MAG TPA: sortase, partial [Anaerolineales bacterium]|nr:sortase [Anaerolineales bacterium]
VVVGAFSADPDLGAGKVTNAGAAFVFEPTPTGWQQTARLVPSQATPFEGFGAAVAIEADRVVVGAVSAQQAGLSGTGAAYLFRRTGKVWQPQTRIVADAPEEQGAFGHAVALDGESLLVGANAHDPSGVRQAGEAFVYRLAAALLPATGFPPGPQHGALTRLSAQPPGRAYTSLGDLWLEIPRLGVEVPVVGVPQSGEGWDTTWLGWQAGYLAGSAYPTWPGNTGLAAHSALPDGLPGPFAGLESLTWGDQVVLHAWGQRYIYSVRQSLIVAPGDLQVLGEENYAWLTLITCTDFDQEQRAYLQRAVVRAVLVEVK